MTLTAAQEPSVRDMIAALRSRYSRRALAEALGSTHAKIANLEKGRTPTDAEADVVRMLWRGSPDLLVDGPSDDTSSDDIATFVSDVTIPRDDTVATTAETSPPEDVRYDWKALAERASTAAPGDTYLGEVDGVECFDVGNAQVPNGDPVAPAGTPETGDAVATSEPRMEPPTPPSPEELFVLTYSRVAAGVASPTELSLLDNLFRVSNSEVQTFKNCPRRWFLAYYLRLRLRESSATGPRAIGTRVHKALAQWYVPHGTPRVDPRDALERLIVEDWTAVVRENPSVETDDPELTKKFTAEADLQRIMLEGYIQWLAETGDDSLYTVVGSEQYAEVDMPGVPGVRMIARLDARVRREHDGARLFLETKTVGEFTTVVRALPMDEQTLWYQLLETLRPDESERVAGALYNMLRKVKRGVTARPPFYQRAEVLHNAHTVDSFRLRLRGTVSRILDTRQRLDSGADHREVAYPTPTRDCAWRCDFFAICTLLDDGSRADAAIAQFYEPGDPLSYYISGTAASEGDSA